MSMESPYFIEEEAKGKKFYGYSQQFEFSGLPLREMSFVFIKGQGEEQEKIQAVICCFKQGGLYQAVSRDPYEGRYMLGPTVSEKEVYDQNIEAIYNGSITDMDMFSAMIAIFRVMPVFASLGLVTAED